jgi:DNA-binding response OmpR family regulator
MPKRILVVDDDPTFSELIRTSLEKLGYAVRTAVDGRNGLLHAYGFRPDLVVLDVMMPGLSGWVVCEQLRRMCDVPIIMLTARSETPDRIRGFELGVDDYMTKPVDMGELLARIKARLRRAPQAEDQGLVFQDGKLVVDLVRSEVTIAGQRVDLTATEYRLLAHFVQNAGRLLSHGSLLRRVWGDEYADELDYLKIYVGRLRQKIEADPRKPRHILTERGLGYRFADHV